MPFTCNYCSAEIADKSLAWWADEASNLFFCSENCYQEFNKIDWESIPELDLSNLDFNFSIPEAEQKDYINVQEWVDSKYPTKKVKAQVQELHLNEPNLVGALDLQEFTSFWGCKIFIFPVVDETKITFVNQPERAKIYLCHAQKAFDREFPKNGSCLGEYDIERSLRIFDKVIINQGLTRKEITQIKFSNKYLAGLLVIKDFLQLEWINLSGNKLTSLTLVNCPQVEVFNCSSNQLVNLILTNCSNLAKIDAYKNQLTDLSAFSHLANLEYLDIRNNNFTGSLESLKNLAKLKYLDITTNTNLTTGLEYLPDSLEKLLCDNQQFPELEKYKKINKEGYEYYDYPFWKEAYKKDQQIILLKQNQAQFTEQEQQINYLEIRIKELTNLIKQQKEKIIKVFVRLFPEEKSVHELILTHLEFKRAEKQELPSRNLRNKFNQLYYQLVNKLEESVMNEIDIILKDCDSLISDEFELEEKLKEKFFLIENQKQNLSQITDNFSANLQQQLAHNEQTQQQQTQEFEQLKTQHLALQLALAKFQTLTPLPPEHNLISELITQFQGKTELTPSEREIIIELNKLMGVKRLFLTNRQQTIAQLQAICNGLESSLVVGKHAKREEKGKYLAVVGKAVSTFTFNAVEAAGEATIAVNNTHKRKFAEENTLEFNQFLAKEEKNLATFETTYHSLINSLKNLNINQELLSPAPTLFSLRYKIYEVATNLWKEDSYVSASTMRDAISLLEANRLALQAELKQQEQLLTQLNQALSKTEYQALVLAN